MKLNFYEEYDKRHIYRLIELPEQIIGELREEEEEYKNQGTATLLTDSERQGSARSVQQKHDVERQATEPKQHPSSGGDT